jgi:hypothetical protein
MKYKIGDVIYKSGNYEVQLEVENYRVINTETGIVEHQSEVLYECMRLARLFDNGINDLLNPPKWSNSTEAVYGEPNLIRN